MMNVYYDSLLRLAKAGKITSIQIETAVSRSWINATEKDLIISAYALT